MKENQNEKSYCAHYASRYLPLTENWIYRLVTNHQTYRPVFLSRKKDNLSLFAFTDLFSLDDFGRIRQYLEIAFFKLSGYFYFQKKVCERNDVKILHVHFGYHGVKMVGLKKKLGVPMICSFYGDDAFARMHAGKYDTLFQVADQILVLGPYMKARLMSLGCAEAKLAIHHLGIDVNKLRFQKRIVKTGDKVRFLIASSFLPKKGVDMAVRALSACKDDFDFTLDIIGDGAQREEISGLIDQGGIRSRVTLHGYKPYAYLIDLAYRCDVFIQASRTTEDNRKEGTPMAIVDTMATGMAVVATRHSDIPEMVVDGETGYLAEENDLPDLIAQVKKILANPEVIEKFSVNARARIEREFNTVQQGIRLEEYYDRLIEKSL